MASDKDDIEEFEDDYDDYDDEEEGGLSGLVVLLMGVVMLGAFASVVWIAYQQGARSADSAPVIAADPEPVRIERAADAGDQPANDREVYDNINGGEAAPVEALANGPEEPVSRDADDAIGQIAAAVDDTVSQAVDDAGEALSGAADDAAAAVNDAITDDAVADRIAQLEAADQALKDDGDAADGAADDASAASDAPVVGERVTPPTQASQTQPEPVEVASNSAAATGGSSAALSGSHLVQVAAFRSEEEANAFWSRMAGKLDGYLDGKAKNIEVADLGDRGVFYRLRIGPFASKSDASQYCSGLKERGQDCIPRAK